MHVTAQHDTSFKEIEISFNGKHMADSRSMGSLNVAYRHFTCLRREVDHHPVHDRTNRSIAQVSYAEDAPESCRASFSAYPKSQQEIHLLLCFHRPRSTPPEGLVSLHCNPNIQHVANA